MLGLCKRTHITEGSNVVQMCMKRIETVGLKERTSDIPWSVVARGTLPPLLLQHNSPNDLLELERFCLRIPLQLNSGDLK